MSSPGSRDTAVATEHQQILSQGGRSAKLSLDNRGGTSMARLDKKVVLISGGTRGQGAAELELAAAFVRHDVTSQAYCADEV